MNMLKKKVGDLPETEHSNNKIFHIKIIITNIKIEKNQKV